MATRIEGPIKLLLYQLVLSKIWNKQEFFQADRNDYMVKRPTMPEFFISLSAFSMSAFSMSACPCPRFQGNKNFNPQNRKNLQILGSFDTSTPLNSAKPVLNLIWFDPQQKLVRIFEYNFLGFSCFLAGNRPWCPKWKSVYIKGFMFCPWTCFCGS